MTVLATAPASASTVFSQAEASAIQVAALSTPLIPNSHAVNYGYELQVVESLDGAIPLLRGVTLVNTAVYNQTAVANDDGTSAACAGIVGTGGALSIGDDGTCTADTTEGPALINLPSFSVAGTGFQFRLEASALYSYCTAGLSDGDSGFSAGSTLTDVTLIANASVLGIPGPDVRIPISADGSFSIPEPFASVISLDVNKVDATGPETSATALHIGLGPNSSIASIDIGKTYCGINATTAEVPGIPLAPGALAVAGGGGRRGGAGGGAPPPPPPETAV
jgi:hypothetical protein